MHLTPKKATETLSLLHLTCSRVFLESKIHPHHHTSPSSSLAVISTKKCEVDVRIIID